MNAPRAGRTINKRQTTHLEFFKLCEWIKTADIAGVYTFTRCAELASAVMKFQVPVTAIQSALEATGRKLEQRPVDVPKTDAQQVIASELCKLMASLGHEPSPELRSIAKSTELF